jgi:UDP-glucose 4-epimerase
VQKTIRHVLVTGGAGFIGSHLAERLLNDDAKVTVLDNLSTGTLRNLDSSIKNRNLTTIKGDITVRADLASSLRGVDSVVHLAAVASVPDSIKDPERTHRINVEGTKLLLESSVEAGVKKFVFASSCAVYGDTQMLPIAESTPMNPLSPYASSKLKGEEMCRAYSGRFANGTTILRFFNVYGPRQERSAYGTVITSFMERLKAGRSPEIHGDGLQTRDFIYITDVVEAIVLALGDERSGEVYNIGSGRELSIIDLERVLSGVLNTKKVEPRFGESRAGDIRRSVADITKARAGLGFEPHVTLESGLRAMLKG